jgi:hypothetical protein
MCTKNEECTGHPGERCGSNGSTNGDPSGFNLACVYDACTSDADCGSAGVCSCGTGAGATNECIAGNCKIDSDCGAGSFCIPEVHGCWTNGAGDRGRIFGYYCTTPRDECNDATIRGGLPEPGYPYCGYNGDHWVMQGSDCGA